MQAVCIELVGNCFCKRDECGSLLGYLEGLLFENTNRVNPCGFIRWDVEALGNSEASTNGGSFSPLSIVKPVVRLDGCTESGYRSRWPDTSFLACHWL